MLLGSFPVDRSIEESENIALCAFVCVWIIYIWGIIARVENFDQVRCFRIEKDWISFCLVEVMHNLAGELDVALWRVG